MNIGSRVMIGAGRHMHAHGVVTAVHSHLAEPFVEIAKRVPAWPKVPTPFALVPAKYCAVFDVAAMRAAEESAKQAARKAKREAKARRK